jgi:TetR/AcrR family transcriptional regulator, transcriptional repressor of bet genes
MGRPSNTEVRREEIIDGLLAVMSERGYERASINEIAKASKLSPGVVHYHFKDKQEILLELVRRLGERISGRTAALLAQAGEDPRRRLDAWIDAHLALGDDADPRAVASWVVLGAEAIRQPEVRRAYASILAADFELLERLVAEALYQRQSKRAGSKAIAAALMAAVQGYFVLSASAPDVTPKGSAAAAVKRMADGLLGGAS